MAQPLRLEEQNRGPFYFDVEDEEDLLEEYDASSAEAATLKEVETSKEVETREEVETRKEATTTEQVRSPADIKLIEELRAKIAKLESHQNCGILPKSQVHLPRLNLPLYVQKITGPQDNSCSLPSLWGEYNGLRL